MRIDGVIWIIEFAGKIWLKHKVSQEEIEQVFEGKTKFRKVEKGHIAGENLYAALGRTHAGRYLIVFFLHKKSQEALVVSARSMTPNEKKRYEQKWKK